MEIFSVIKEMLVKELALDDEAVVPEAHLQDDLGADSLDLGRLQPLSNQILASGGSLDLDLRLDGSLERPELFGNLNIDDGELQLAPLGERFTQIQSRLVFDGNRIVINSSRRNHRQDRHRLPGRSGFRTWRLLRWTLPCAVKTSPP